MTDWLASAACKGDPTPFFDATRVNEAIAICRACPVITECDAHATTLDVDEGVWGGQLRGITHGSHTGYPRGCRCADCRRTRHETQERHRLRKKRSDPTKTLSAAERAAWAEILERQGRSA